MFFCTVIWEIYDLFELRFWAIDLLMGLFRGAVLRHGRGAWKQPTEMPTKSPH